MWPVACTRELEFAVVNDETVLYLCDIFFY